MWWTLGLLDYRGASDVGTYFAVTDSYVSIHGHSTGRGYSQDRVLNVDTGGEESPLP